MLITPAIIALQCGLLFSWHGRTDSDERGGYGVTSLQTPPIWLILRSNLILLG